MFFLVNENGNIKTAANTPLSVPGLQEIELEVAPDHPLFSDFSAWKVIDGELIEDEDNRLEHLREVKLEELRDNCQKAIEAGFSHTFNDIEYWFSMDAEAQSNFLSAYQVMRDDIIPEMPWTVKVGGVSSVTWNSRDCFFLFSESLLFSPSRASKEPICANFPDVMTG